MFNIFYFSFIFFININILAINIISDNELLYMTDAAAATNPSGYNMN